jgi:peptidyl-tRNA hydrolase
MKPIKEMLADIQQELTRSKTFINENGYHHGTAICEITRNYRSQLKKLYKIMYDDMHLDSVETYTDH